MSLHRSTAGFWSGVALTVALVVTPGAPAGADAGGSLELAPATGPAGAAVTLAEGVQFPEFVCSNTGTLASGQDFEGPFSVEWSLRRGNGPAPSRGVFDPGGSADKGTEIASGETTASRVGAPATTTVQIPADAAPGSWFFATGDCVDADGRLVFGYTFAIVYVVEGAGSTTTTTSGPPSTPTTSIAPPAPVAAPVPASPSYTG